MDCLHDYTATKGTNSGIVERCNLCAHRNVTRKSVAGTINNKAYLAEHKRDFLQPNGRTARLFKKAYGEPNYEWQPSTE